MSTLRAVPPTPPSALHALARRVLDDLDGLVTRMGEAYRREIPEYAEMSDAHFVLDVLPASRKLVEDFLAGAVTGAALTPKQLQTFERIGRERLAMGIRLESVLHAYRVAGHEVWTAVCGAVLPGEEHLLAGLGTAWIDIVDRASTLIASSYLSASHDRLRSLDARRRELVEALLTAVEPSDVAAVSLRFSTVLAPAYVPVLVAGGGAVTGIDALLAGAPKGTLGGHRGDRVLLLVPQRLDAPVTRSGAVVAWGRPAACGPELLAEVTSVERLLSTALREGRTEGSFGPDDLLVEQLLLGNERVAGALRRRVLDVLQARDPGGVLVSTLRTYLATGSVPETAKAEVVHPNTVGYRLGRVRDLTGLDPRVPQDIALLVLGTGLPVDPAEG